MQPRSILQDAIAGKAFPGASVWLERRDEPLCAGEIGHLGYEAPFLAPVTADTLYDLASLTKLYTLTAALLVADECGIDLEHTPIADFFPAFPKQLTLVHLLQHTAGLGVEIQALEDVPAEDWLPELASAPLRFEPGTQGLYSCSNYFVLARILEQAAGESLNALMEQHLLCRPGLSATTFAPSERQVVAPTEAKPDGGYWEGEVHDEAARSWYRQTKTCAGNAGLFATAGAVAAFGRLWLEPGVLPEKLVQLALQSPVAEKSYHRAWGWQVSAAFYMGDYAPPGTLGHTGFTGPTLVLNPATGHLAVLLSNRVHPTRTGPDRLPFYRQLHDWLFQSA